MTTRVDEKTESPLLALAERCERATGPDRELDGDIGRVTGAWRTQPTFREYRPTASIDAALTLLPGQDWEFSVEWETGSDGHMFARCALGDPMRLRDCEAPTIALAICAAALRARAA